MFEQKHYQLFVCILSQKPIIKIIILNYDLDIH